MSAYKLTALHIPSQSRENLLLNYAYFYRCSPSQNTRTLTYSKVAFDFSYIKEDNDEFLLIEEKEAVALRKVESRIAAKDIYRSSITEKASLKFSRLERYK